MGECSVAYILDILKGTIQLLPDHMHLIGLAPEVTVESDPTHREYDLYDPETGVCRFRDRKWEIIGLHAGRPILTGRNSEQPVLDEEAQTVSVLQGGSV